MESVPTCNEERQLFQYSVCPAQLMNASLLIHYIFSLRIRTIVMARVITGPNSVGCDVVYKGDIIVLCSHFN